MRRIQLVVVLSFSFHLYLALSDFPAAPLNTQVITSSPDENVLLALRIPLIFEFTEHSEREFEYRNDNNTIDVIIITLKDLNGSSQRNNVVPQLKLKGFKGNCLESTSEISWMCYNLPENNTLQKFSLYNPGVTYSFEIIISEVTAQEIDPKAEIQLNSSIPGIGTLFKVNLSDVGVLRVRVDMTTKDKPLPIIGASSLGDLFNLLSGKSLNSSSSLSELRSSLDQGLTIQNKQLNTSWYYLIPVHKEQNNLYQLSSHFIKQAILEIGTQEIYLIDPEIYEYQHIKVNLKDARLPGMYHVLVCTLESTLESAFSRDIYLDTDSYFDNGSFLTIEAVDESTLYLNIHATHTRNFRVRVDKLDDDNASSWLIEIKLSLVLVVLVVSCSICLMKACYMKKTINNDLEEPESQQDNLASILEKLEEQEQRDNLIKTKTGIMEESEEEENNRHLVIEINDEEKCDVCYEVKKSITFDPCGHKCTCASCARSIVSQSMKCPLCRADIKQVQIDQNIELKQRK